MFRNHALKIVNMLLYISSTLLLSSGLVMAYRLEGPRLKGAHLLGMSKHTWSEFHFILGLTTATLVALHLWLNWGWIMKVAARGVRWRVSIIIAFAVFVIAAVLFSPVYFPNRMDPLTGNGVNWQQF
jgi:hypothetical protein